MKKILFVCCAFSCSFFAAAQGWPDTVAHIEKIFSRYNSHTVPGAELAISRNGQVIFSKAWGMADLEHNIALTPQSLVEAGSVSKQFTAASILLLEQQGKLSLEDDVRKYIPELPDYGKVITLRHMMQHTSGLKDWGSVMDLAGWSRGTRVYSNEYALYVISLQQTLNNIPGDEYIYSNSNYNLQAIIVQRVSGLSLADFTSKYIFEPAGMKHTEWRSNFRKVVKDRAIAYSKGGGQNFLINMPNENAYGNGGLLTTAEDLLIWNHYYLSGKLGNPSLLPKQTATNKLNSGRTNNYAAGLMLDSIAGWQAISHSGATASYRANLEYFPEAGLSIAWLSNTSAFDSDTLNVSNAVRRLFLPVRPAAPRPRPAAVTVAPEKLAAYAGWYRDPRNNAGLKLYVKDGKLSSLFPTANLMAIADNVFMLGNNKLELGYKKGLLASAGPESIYYEKMEDVDANPKYLEDFVGQYYSKEAEAMYYMVLKDGRLLLQIKPTTTFPMNATYKDAFDCTFGPVYFIRDLKRGIMELRISVGRARNVVFKRVYTEAP
ncbi:class A beta-lactamase-related serine hydrolase [Paraflavitalea soli]|uniref:Class A beta-lactamase-related serine hydrolase n=1 Tax=Paraflavitalea soli TaxID=2315862 RepID=A0A3B7MQF7_9BACT|nr:serine hydrolase domain-containing protein [Paraflavitalea soli]AXY76722.1 class A beta-lactamase-related serine hydrolase [Paraflavitalea soli]